MAEKTIKVNWETFQPKANNEEINFPYSVNQLQTKCCALVYHEEDQVISKEKIIPTLQKEGVCCREYQECSYLGKTLFDNYEHLLANTDKVLFIISKSFNASRFLSQLANITMVQKEHCNVICLLLNDTTLLPALQGTKVVKYIDQEWPKHLVKYVCSPLLPHFCKNILPMTFSDVLFAQGIRLENMLMSMFGIIMQVNTDCVSVDISEYMAHMRDHAQRDIIHLCSECVALRTPETKVSLVIKKNVQTSEESDIENLVQLKKDFVFLCSNVMEISGLRAAKIPFTLGITVKGSLPDSDLIRNIWLNIFFVEFPKKRQQIETTKFPEYESKSSRLASFPEPLPEDIMPNVEDLSEAGFFFKESFNSVTCFTCGVSKRIWRKDDNAWLNHAALDNSCLFVRRNLKPDVIEGASYINHKYEINEQFESLQSRLDTFKQSILGEDLITELAQSGFYMAGNNMYTCFNCGLIINLGNTTTNITVEHVLGAPKCPYLLSFLGRNHIKNIVDSSTSPEVIVTFRLKTRNDVFKPTENFYMFTPFTPKK